MERMKRLANQPNPLYEVRIGRRDRRATVVGVEYFTFHERKIRMEIRLSKQGYTVTLVGRGNFPLSHVVNVLKKKGYDLPLLTFDRWGYARVIYRGLNDSDLVTMRKIISKEIKADRKRALNADIELVVS